MFDILEKAFKDFRFFILVDKQAIEVSVVESFQWMHDHGDQRVIKQTPLGEGVSVSTVFLPFDHNWNGNGYPQLFETMIFGGKYDMHMWRYSVYEEAEEGHLRVCELVMEKQAN